MRKKLLLIFSITLIISTAFLFPNQQAYAVSSNYVDGGQVANLSTNCASKTTIATLSTTLPAASASSPNIIIATTDFVSDDAGVEQVISGAGATGLYRDGTLQVGMQYNFFANTANLGNHYTFLFEDAGGSANVVYTIQGCASATSIETEAKVLAFQGLESSYIDSGNTATTAGSFVTIASLTTDLTANNQIIITMIQIDFDRTSTIAAGDIELQKSDGTLISENQFEIIALSVASGAYYYYVTAPFETIVICELIDKKPFYDCPESVDGKRDFTGEVWTLHLYHGGQYSTNCSKFHSDSCAFWFDVKNANVAYINVDNKNWVDPNPHRGQWGKSPLAHELEHLDCRCNWH